MSQEVLSPMGEVFAHPAVGAEGIEVARGATIYTQGSQAEHVYYIHRGQVRLYQVGPDGEEARLVEILGPGQWFGCASLSQAGTYVAQAVAATEATLSKVAAIRFLEHVSTNPEAAQQLIRNLASTVHSARNEAARLVFQDCNQRLLNAMLRFSDSAAATSDGENVVLHLTHEQLAQAVGAARETISLALTELRHKNLVRTGRNRLMFNRDALRTFAAHVQSQRDTQPVA
ncbi:MAG: family transcriptional regulator, cyclic receptor protein [Phycisphaerales bacterium]|jgi:CRP-like cAMP-binding protein|nr:family transcriptional regulator, cyclic receptor protein [Phycisphaerales bacterium]MEA2733870.1 family transcriptional regulator, cyclic receptor protein [Humisphaera sp.]